MKARVPSHGGQRGDLPFNIGGYLSLSLFHKAGMSSWNVRYNHFLW
jgi:hypothetical protein